MKHIKKFEDVSYRDSINAEIEARKQREKAEEERIAKMRAQSEEGKYLSKLQADAKQRQASFDTDYSNRFLLSKVRDFIQNDERGVSGFESFKEELEEFLKGFPNE